MFGLDMSDAEVFWLNVTNVGLGIVTIVCLVMLACGIFYQLSRRHRKRPGGPDDPALDAPELGLTMADGGKPTSRRNQTGEPE